MAGNSYPEFIEFVKECQNAQYAAGILGWDQETYMPQGGAMERAHQMATMAKWHHDYFTSDKMRGYLEELRRPDVLDGMTPEQQTNVRETAWAYEREVSIPGELVKEMAKHTSMSLEAWKKARADDAYSHFAPFLEKMIDLKVQMAEHIGYEDNLYDALIDEYEPGTRTKDVQVVFADLRERLVPIVKKIIDSDVTPNEAILAQPWPLEKQKEFGVMVVGDIGYEWERGRLDEAPHPFTSGAIDDVRITTRYNAEDIRPALFANIHEAGHAMYQQGLNAEHYATPMGESIGLGFHESQSRMWENIVGRSMPFWRHYYPKLQSTFPGQVGSVPIEDFYAAANLVKPSLIRVEADEVTYNLHILIRFEMELAMMNGDIGVDEIPGLWNEKYKSYLGIDVPSDADGCMQDIHWSMGIQGYFPTYTFGNLISVQLWNTMIKEIPDIWDQIEAGRFSGLLSWLQENVHRPGKMYRTPDMLRHLTGEPMNADHWIGYIKEKFGPIYGVQL
jgi:carboxypeptidase Taq